MSLVLTSWPKPGIATLTLNDPDSRNAMSERMADEFYAAIGDLGAKKDLRALIITGAGSAFSGGGHLDMLFEKTKLSRDENQSRMVDFYKKFLSVRECPVPVIAALNGHAVGAALGLALGCDIRVSSSATKLGMNFVHLGLHPGMGATFSLPYLIGYERAAELLFTGAIIPAEEAQKMGLLQHVVPPEAVLSKAQAIAETISSAGPVAVRQLKQSLLAPTREALQSALKREAECQGENYVSAEFLEGITAAREKRKPQFS